MAFKSFTIKLFHPSKPATFLRLAAAFLAISPSLIAQNPSPLGSWNSYTSFFNAGAGTLRDEEVWVATQGGIFSYNIPTGEIETFSTVDGMSGIEASTIYHDSSSGKIFIGFANGMINFFDTPDVISVITDIERSEAFNSKRINRFISHNGYLYIATNFGIVVFDIAKNETRFSVTKIGNVLTGSVIEDLTVFNDTLWAAMGINGLFKVPLSHPNITDPTAWLKEADTSNFKEGRVNFVTSANGMVYSHVYDTIYRKANGNWEIAPMTPIEPVFLRAESGSVVATANNHLEALYPGDSLVFCNNGGTPNFAIATSNEIWLGSQLAGLQKFRNNEFFRLNPDGPWNNLSEQVIPGNGEFYLLPYASNSSHIVPGEDGIYYYSYQDGWKNINKRNGYLTDYINRGFANGYVDPVNDTAYITSKGWGLRLMYHGDTVRSYNHLNSSMENPIGVDDDDIRANSVVLDRFRNIWITTILAEGDRLLSVITPEGDHYAYSLPGVRPLDVVIDEFDQKWIANDGGGVAVFSDNGTLDDPSDDLFRNMTSAVGNGDLPTVNVYSIAKDKNGHIWVGTNDGITVFYDPFSVFTEFASDASCPVFEFQCLMKFQRVQDIAVDGANRKWIATDQGAFLISEDGTEQVYHLTTDNSPLFSNDIRDIAVNPFTGEVYFATDKGMLSFMGDAIEGISDCSELYAFPNPVLPGYYGDVTIRGMPENSVCKISGTSGLMLREVDSFGGQAIWDGNDQWGNRARPGIYIVMIADENGENSCFTKVAVVEN